MLYFRHMPKKSAKDTHKKIHDIIAIGDATLDTFIQIDDASVLCNLQKDVCVLCLSYADKIAVGRPIRTPGGNAANNAVGSSRLGLKAAIYTVLGSDETGHKIRQVLKDEGVSTEYVSLDKGTETNTATVLNYKGERTILVYHADRKYKLPKFKESRWIYLTSIGKNHLSLHDEVIGYLKNHDTKLAFNPGTHQLKQGLDKLKPVLEVTDVLFVNKEEAKRLVGEIAEMKDLLSAVHRVGPEIVVITDGQNGSYVHDGKKFWKCGITDTPIVERTGAGDSFGTAFLAALRHGKDIPEALRWGTMNSGSVITKIGPQAGLLTKNQMVSWLKKYSKIKAVML
jgi:sugar/nucleoside kinase (ribokinase family)